MDSFLDANVPLADIFSIEPNNTIAKRIFKLYDNYFAFIFILFYYLDLF